MAGSSALQWLREDQRSSGMSVREYERHFGVYLSDPDSDKKMGRAADIASHESNLSPVAETIGIVPHCPSCSRRLHQRRVHEDQAERLPVVTVWPEKKAAQTRADG